MDHMAPLLFVIVIVAMVMWFVLRLVDMNLKAKQRYSHVEPSGVEMSPEDVHNLQQRAEALQKRINTLEEILQGLKKQ